MRYSIIIILFSVLFVHCSFQPPTESTMLVRYLLLLEDDSNSTEIESEYKGFGLQKLTKTSKSQKLYAADFNVSNSKLEILVKKMKDDKRIIEATRQFEDVKKPENSTNNKMKKIKPMGIN